MANLGPNFYAKLVQLASETGMKPEDILAVMVSESGFNPHAQNPHGGATGLMQFAPGTLKGVGFAGSSQEFSQLDGEERLPYIKKLIEGNMRLNGGPFTSAGQYYVGIFFPVALKLPGVRQGDPNTPIVEENPETVGQYSKKYYDLGFKIPASLEHAAYVGNPLFHGNTPGIITYGDMIHRAEKNKRNPLYSQALASMHQQTGYVPNSNHIDTVPDHMLGIQPSTSSSTFMDILNQLAQSLMTTASELPSKKLYQKMLPNHHILIQISASDYTDAIEFSRILCAALDEEVCGRAYPHTDGHQIVEVECSIPGPALGCLQAVEQLNRSLINAFKDATQKIGGITVKTHCIMNKKSFYQPISLRIAETNYRKFLLKFI